MRPPRRRRTGTRARRAAALLAALTLAATAAPALAGPNPAGRELYAFATGAQVSVRVEYFDGLGSTKFAFNQFSGEQGQAEDRLEPGAECTEWVGRFTQVMVQARAQDNVDRVRVRLAGYDAAFPPGADGARDEPGFVLEALGAVGAFDGVLLVCDNAAGNGVVSFQGTLHDPPLLDAYAGIVRIVEED